MITLYHCAAARSFRPLWMLEELGLPYELKMLPFPPRVFAKEYLALNPLGTIPFMIDGETKMSESSGICHYLGTRYGPTPLMVGVDDPAYGAFLNWMYFSDATLTFPQTLVLRYSRLEPEERRNPLRPRCAARPIRRARSRPGSAARPGHAAACRAGPGRSPRSRSPRSRSARTRTGRRQGRGASGRSGDAQAGGPPRAAPPG